MVTDQKGKLTKKKLLLIIGIVLIVGGLIWAITLLTRNQTLHITDKSRLKAEIKTVLDIVHFSGKQVSTDLADLGCDNRNSVGLQLYIHCDFKGHSYFKNQENASADLRSADSVLVNSGWKRAPFEGQSSADFEQILDGIKNSSIQYKREGSEVSVFLGYYKDDQHVSEYEIRDLIDAKKINPPTQNEYIFGIRIEATYWSCTNESLFTQRCPAPPSEK